MLLQLSVFYHHEENEASYVVWLSCSKELCWLFSCLSDWLASHHTLCLQECSNKEYYGDCTPRVASHPILPPSGSAPATAQAIITHYAPPLEGFWTNPLVVVGEARAYHRPDKKLYSYSPWAVIMLSHIRDANWCLSHFVTYVRMTPIGIYRI